MLHAIRCFELSWCVWRKILIVKNRFVSEWMPAHLTSPTTSDLYICILFVRVWYNWISHFGKWNFIRWLLYMNVNALCVWTLIVVDVWLYVFKKWWMVTLNEVLEDFFYMSVWHIGITLSVSPSILFGLSPFFIIR